MSILSRFKIDGGWLSSVKLPYRREDTRSSYGISRWSQTSSISGLAICYGGLDRKELLAEIVKKHGLTEIKRDSSVGTNPYWDFYVTSYDWAAHEKKYKRRIEEIRVSQMAELLEEYSTADLKKVIALRESGK